MPVYQGYIIFIFKPLRSKEEKEEDMKTRTKLSCWILLMQIIIVSCSDLRVQTIEPQTVEPPVKINEEYLNHQILVHAPESFNSYKTNDAVILEVISNSNNEIRFPNNYNVKIFKQTSNGWIEVKEIPTNRLPKDDIVFSPSTFGMQDLAVFPDLGDSSQRYKLRFYVIGDMKTNAESIAVAAFIDVELHP